MCDDTLENYRDAIDAVSDPHSDLVPTLLFFSEPNCAGSFEPNSGGDFVTNPYTIDTYAIPLGAFKSFFMPFNFLEVTFTRGALTSTFQGPYTEINISNQVWQSDATSSWADFPPTQFQVKELNGWLTQAVVTMCTGKPEFIDDFPLRRYLPQSERCDTFMQSTWCQGKTRLNTDTCACFEELPAIEAKSKEVGVNLSVRCFGFKCATTDAYATFNMLNQPCNLTVCEQLIQESPGVIDSATNTVFCGGQFFNQQGVVPNPSTSPIPSVSSNVSPDATPFYTWIMVGAAGLIFVVLVVLLFLPQTKKKSNLLQQIKRLKVGRRVSPSPPPPPPSVSTQT